MSDLKEIKPPINLIPESKNEWVIPERVYIQEAINKMNKVQLEGKQKKEGVNEYLFKGFSPRFIYHILDKSYKKFLLDHPNYAQNDEIPYLYAAFRLRKKEPCEMMEIKISKEGKIDGPDKLIFNKPSKFKGTKPFSNTTTVKTVEVKKVSLSYTADIVSTNQFEVLYEEPFEVEVMLVDEKEDVDNSQIVNVSANKKNDLIRKSKQLEEDIDSILKEIDQQESILKEFNKLKDQKIKENTVLRAENVDRKQWDKLYNLGFGCSSCTKHKREKVLLKTKIGQLSQEVSDCYQFHEKMSASRNPDNQNPVVMRQRDNRVHHHMIKMNLFSKYHSEVERYCLHLIKTMSVMEKVYIDIINDLDEKLGNKIVRNLTEKIMESSNEILDLSEDEVVETDDEIDF